MVIFTTDNGLYHGEHGLAGKWYPHTESIKVPLLIYDPRLPIEKRHGTTTIDDTFTLNVDLAPTIIGAAGLKNIKPHGMQGFDLSTLYLDDSDTDVEEESVDDDEPDTDDCIFSSIIACDGQTIKMQRRLKRRQRRRRRRTEFYYEHPTLFGSNRIPGSTALVRKEWKYIVWSMPSNTTITMSSNVSDSNIKADSNNSDNVLEQLFHLKDDPYEEDDLRYDSRHSIILDEMRQRHDEWKEWVKR